jgi:metal-responsive CopG/Arc/MetJ family transcriptional regulator
MTMEKAKILITLEDTLLTHIDDYRFDNRINSRSEAIRRLIESGLETSGTANANIHKKNAPKLSAKGKGK